MTFKAGDLVQIVGCINPTMKHHVGKVGKIVSQSARWSGNYYVDCARTSITGNEVSWGVKHLIKIDPPAEGETREAYRNLKVPA